MTQKLRDTRYSRELANAKRPALRAGVFSETFIRGLGRLMAQAGGPSETAPAPPATALPSADLGKVQAHFHALIRSRAGERIGDQASSLPDLSREAALEAEPAWFPVDSMDGASSIGGTLQRPG